MLAELLQLSLAQADHTLANRRDEIAAIDPGLLRAGARTAISAKGNAEKANNVLNYVAVAKGSLPEAKITAHKRPGSKS